MLKKSLCLLFLSAIISLPAIASDDEFTYDATVQYHADCPDKNYEKCARENNKEIIIKGMHEDSTILDVKNDVFKQEKGDKRFAPSKQVVTCAESLWPDDNDYADICWNDDLEGALFELHLRKD